GTRRAWLRLGWCRGWPRSRRRLRLLRRSRWRRLLFFLSRGGLLWRLISGCLLGLRPAGGLLSLCRLLLGRGLFRRRGRLLGRGRGWLLSLRRSGRLRWRRRRLRLRSGRTLLRCRSG